MNKNQVEKKRGTTKQPVSSVERISMSLKLAISSTSRPCGTRYLRTCMYKAMRALIVEACRTVTWPSPEGAVLSKYVYTHTYIR